MDPRRPVRHARPDPRLRARVVERRALRYVEGADPALDRPAHVRAASALVAVGRGHLVVQDDTLFLGAVTSSEVTAATLPSPAGVRQFGDDRGNKAAKPDLEAGCRWPSAAGDLLVAFGSGSTPARERVLLVPLRAGGLGAPTFAEAPELYALLRDAVGDAELNVEGAWRSADGHLRLLQRGNGRGALDAALEVDGAWLDALVSGRRTDPRLRSAARWELGALDGVRLTFTDGAALEEGRWLFSAAAEASPDAVADGPVAGSVVGWTDDASGWWAPVVDQRGAPCPCKLEGLARTAGGELLGVVDADDPTRPSELLRLRLEGPWPPELGLSSGPRSS